MNVHVYRPHLYYYTDYSDLSFGTTEVSSLRDRRRELCESLFRQIVSDESHVLHYLLTAKRDSLRSAKTVMDYSLAKFIFP